MAKFDKEKCHNSYEKTEKNNIETSSILPSLIYIPYKTKFLNLTGE